MQESPQEKTTSDHKTEDRREQTYLPAYTPEKEVNLVKRLGAIFTGFQLEDVLSAKTYSADFKDTYSEYILPRIRFMAFFFAIAVPFWIPVDYLTLNETHYSKMVMARGVLFALLLTCGLVSLKKLSNRNVVILLGITMITPAIFYVISGLILRQGAPEVSLAGYVYLPYLIIAMLGLFPITIITSVTILGILLLLYLGLEVLLGSLFTIDTLNLLWAFLLFAGIVVWIQVGQLLMLLKLYRQSTRDPLTGLSNRRILMKRLYAEVEIFYKKNRIFSVLMLDLDRFKRINDTWGHQTGDLVLKTTAMLLEQQLRSSDILARYGGEEFVVVLPGLSGQKAVSVAERIRKACCDTTVETREGEIINLSISIGVTEFESGESIETTLNRADDALYKAKKAGRNQVIYITSKNIAELENLLDGAKAELPS